MLHIHCNRLADNSALMTHIIDQARATQVVQEAIQANLNKAGPLLPILRHIQGQLKHIPESSVGTIAQALNLSRAEVHGVVSFYHTFTSDPQGKHIIEVCRAESCQAMGGRELESKFKEALGIDFQETTADGEFSLEAVYCLGNCACSPAIRIGEQVHGRMTAAKADAILNSLKGDAS
jgi:formate dehydrogenase subunit gamma